jgi:type IV pilus assembly protein PilQ
MVKVGRMRNTKRAILVACMFAAGVSGASARPWGARAKSPSAAGSASPAASVLSAIEIETSPARLILRTSGTPVYTTYSPQPGVFVVDLTGVAKASSLSVPTNLPAGLASVSADEAVEMGNGLTRVTLRFNTPQSVQAAAIDNSVVITLPEVSEAGPAIAETAATPAPVAVATETAPAISPVPAAIEPAVSAAVADPAPPLQTAAAEPSRADVQADTIVENAPASSVAELQPRGKATVLTSVETSGSGASLVVRLSGDGEIRYKSFRLENPIRIVLDLIGIRNGMKQPNLNLGDPYVKRIRISQFKAAPDPVTRVVLDLDEKVEYQVSASGSSVAVAFGGTPAMMPEPVVAAAAVMAPAVVASAPPPAAVAPVRKSPKTATKAAAHSKTPAAAPEWAATAAPAPDVANVAVPAPAGAEPKKAASTVEVSAPKSRARATITNDVPSQVPTIAQNAEWKMPSEPMRVINAPSPQTAPRTPPTTTTTPPSSGASNENREDVFNEGSPQQPASSNATVTPTTTNASGTQQTTLSGTVSQSAGGRILGSNDKVYTGEPISLNLKDADIKDVLRTFAQLTGLNIAVDPFVKGTVTVEFNEVPWDQALELILRQNQLTYVLEGNVMRVGYLNILVAEAQAQHDILEAERLNVALQTISFKLSYARAADVEHLLIQMASPRARIITDARTNQIVISDIPAYLQTMKNLIDSVDVPTPQVVIEARIVETTKTFLQQYGVTWGFGGNLNPGLGTGTGLQFPNSVKFDAGPFAFATGTPVLDLTLSNVLGTFDLDFLLAASESEGLVKVISAPKITTQDNVSAEISSGLSIPFQTRINFTTTISYVDAVLRLAVRPQITAQDTIIMDIEVSKVEPALGLALEGSAGTPLSKRSATTKLMVRDGGTSVIGGIYQASENNSQSRVPFLHEIPVLGNLFKNHNVSSRHDELLIFITPRIVKNS